MLSIQGAHHALLEHHYGLALRPSILSIYLSCLGGQAYLAFEYLNADPCTYNALDLQATRVGCRSKWDGCKTICPRCIQQVSSMVMTQCSYRQVLIPFCYVAKKVGQPCFQYFQAQYQAFLAQCWENSPIRQFRTTQGAANSLIIINMFLKSFFLTWMFYSILVMCDNCTPPKDVSYCCRASIAHGPPVGHFFPETTQKVDLEHCLHPI